MDNDTAKTMLYGLIPAIIISLAFYNYIFPVHWPFLTGFPIGWISIGHDYMVTFFHELGHTFTALYYGYPTLPSFDFQHGGGMAWMLDDQQIVLLIITWLLLIYGIVHFKEYRPLQIVLGALLLFNLGTFFNENLRFIMIDFMGPAAVPLVAAFLLVRALFDLAPHGKLERVLNAYFGLSFIFYSLIECYGLVKSQTYRLVYYQQKGQHGFGDFDKVDARIPFLEFEGVIMVWAALNIICLLVPFVLYMRLRGGP